MKARSFFKSVAAAALLLVLTIPQAQAQRQSGMLGIGGQIGEPSGISLIYYQPSGMSYDFLAAWDLSDDFFFINGHGLFENHLGQSQRLHLFYGPGAFVGFKDRKPADDDIVAGISATAGLGVMIDRFEIYGQLTPRLALTPSTEGDLGGGLGFRFYF